MKSQLQSLKSNLEHWGVTFMIRPIFGNPLLARYTVLTRYSNSETDLTQKEESSKAKEENGCRTDTVIQKLVHAEKKNDSFEEEEERRKEERRLGTSRRSRLESEHQCVE